MAAPTVHSPRKPIVRRTSTAVWALMAISVGVAFIPVIGGAVAGAIAHGVDRIKNKWEAHDEIKLRANYYRNIVAARLGKDPSKVTVGDFQLVAKSDPTFSKVIKDVEKKESEANRDSLLMNTGVAVAGIIPGLGGVAHLAHLGAETGKAAKIGYNALGMARAAAGGMAGSALASIFKSDEVSAQEVVERIHGCILDAQDRGLDARKAVTPQLVFLLRVSQDPAFAEEIKRNFGGGKHGFHQMNEAQQTQVMQHFPALANAATSEAYAVSTQMMTVQELAARAPNLNSNAAKYAIGAENATFAPAQQGMSFAERLGNRAPASSRMEAIDAERAAAAAKAQQGTVVQS